MKKIKNVPEMDLVDDFITGEVAKKWPKVPKVKKHKPLFKQYRETNMTERAAEKAEFWRDYEREHDCE